MSQSDFVTRGQALVSSGQYQEAVKVCRLGLLGRPTTVEGRVVLGQALLALKRYDEVLAEMRVALELDHGSQPAQVLKGEALLRKGDGHGALETLGKLRSQGVADARIAELIAEAERLASRSAPGQASLAASYLAQDPAAFASEQGTKNYPAHQASGIDPDAFEGAEFTSPTSLAAPGARRRSSPGGQLAPDATPSPAVLAVGDRSGTVEVDPDLEALELRGEDDFGEAVGPPVDRGADLDAAATGILPSPASPRPSPAAAAVARKLRRAAMFSEEVSTVELGDDEVIELEDRASPRGKPAAHRSPGSSAVRAAVKLPSGPLEAPVAPRPTEPVSVSRPAEPPFTSRPMAPPAPVQPHLAQMIASQPHVMNVMPAAPMPAPINPRSAIAAAMPTAAAMPMPPQFQAMQAAGQGMAMAPPMAMGPPMGSPMAINAPAQAMQPPPHLQATLLAPPGGPAHALHQLPPHLQSSLAAARPTIAINPQPPFDPMQGPGGAPPAWARPTVMPAGSPPYGARAAADEPTRQPQPIDPQIAAMQGQGPGGVPMLGFAGEPGSAPGKSSPSGRRGRSRWQFVVWVMISAAVISGGVVAGFGIRNLRLRHQIAAARDRAVDAAKADVWQGWIGARDSLYGIAQAQPTLDNRAALARAQGVLALEFGDGLAIARAEVETFAGKSGLDIDLATAYVALALRDARAAHDAAERAVKQAPSDAAALYVSGQAALLAGDLKAALTALRGAVERDPRPHYLIGLARALGEAAAWDEAITTLDRVRDNPGAVIARTLLLTGAGRTAAGPGGATGELRAQLARLISDGPKAGDQAASPAQVGFAQLALARLDFARGERGAARTDYLGSLGPRLDDQRYAEEFCDTALAIGELEPARRSAIHALELWPASRRARITLAQIWLGLGKPAAAVELFTRNPDAAAGPAGQTVRGQARLAAGDVDGARADFDAALKKLPGYEPAVVARAWLDLAAGELDEARRRIEPKFNPKTATPAMIAIYAAIQRVGGDPAARARAKTLLERAVGASGPDAARAQLELARIDRDLGDLTAARAAYAEASRAGLAEARLESGALLIEAGDPRGGRETLEQLVKEAGDHPPPALLLETARARTLTGDHTGALAMLALVDKLAGIARWQLDRERARVALRRGDVPTAVQAVERALEGCGGDADTFLLAADTVSTDEKQTVLAGKLRSAMVTRLKGRPELDVVRGKLHLAANQYEQAEKVYSAAREALVKASPRRRAQADFGLAAVAYFRRDDPAATSRLDLVSMEDPSIYAAYLFAAEIERTSDAAAALDKAQKSVAFNPDSVDGWKMVGTLAAQVGKRKLLDEAIARLRELAPGGEDLRQLQRLR
ncbi:MAG: tetratricopeptide repeat protein [Deltaproteobacteria bacterium]|nr:MAG: tetratricopeptide repeat protein [Deltaproteobacteria bacterium]